MSIVPVALPSVMVAFTGFDSTTRNVSLASFFLLSERIGTRIVLICSPAAKFRVPVVVV